MDQIKSQFNTFFSRFPKSRTSNFDNDATMFAVQIDDHELCLNEWRVIKGKY